MFISSEADDVIHHKLQLTFDQIMVPHDRCGDQQQWACMCVPDVMEISQYGCNHTMSPCKMIEIKNGLDPASRVPLGLQLQSTLLGLGFFLDHAKIHVDTFVDLLSVLMINGFFKEKH